MKVIGLYLDAKASLALTRARAVRKLVVFSDFHSVSVCETSQIVETILWGGHDGRHGGGQNFEKKNYNFDQIFTFFYRISQFWPNFTIYCDNISQFDFKTSFIISKCEIFCTVRTILKFDKCTASASSGRLLDIFLIGSVPILPWRT